MNDFHSWITHKRDFWAIYDEQGPHSMLSTYKGKLIMEHLAEGGCFSMQNLYFSLISPLL